ncbi:MAG: thioredoxin domain-containing protein [Myxococcota bacterium]
MDDPAAPDRPSNRLAGETSAYLRQHMYNPVDWHPWGPEALERARHDDKPLLVSVGYSACHWCHVMERESFEEPETARLMNELFVNVKVDREERPDVDQLYMDVLLRLTGHGGWPLTVFCTPDGRPFHAGTYFPPEPRHGLPSFRQVLEATAHAYRSERVSVDEQAGRILAALRSRPRGVAEQPPGTPTLVAAARAILASADREHGGFGAGPKFPTPTSLDALLAAQSLLPAQERESTLEFLRHTCREMSRRGLYDHLGGGFHRYCVDGHWGVPHFEKMLYDQGLLLRTYAETWRRSGAREAALAWPVRETFRWLQREMRGPEGGFYASQDADSEGEEGKFYVWTPAEVEAVLGRERGSAFAHAYGVGPGGNFEGGTTVLWDLERAPRPVWETEREQLREARSRRVPPATDRKRLTSWNAFAISGLAFAGSLLEDEPMLDCAREIAEFVDRRLVDADGRLLRVFNEGRAHTNAFLDDVAALLAAHLDLHRAGAGDRHLGRALALAEDLVERFYDPDEGDLFLTPTDGERLAERPRSDSDGATPHSPGLAVLGLLRAATLSGRGELRSVAERVARTHAFLLERAPGAFPTLARASAWLERGLSVAVVVGAADDAARASLAARARRLLEPEEAVVVVDPRGLEVPGLDPAWLAGRMSVDGRPTAYLCHGLSCSAPVTDPDALEAAARGPAAVC